MKRTILGLILVLVLTRTESPGQGAPAATNVVGAPARAVAPYLQWLGPDSVAVYWQTPQRAYGWVECGETPAFGTKRDASVHGLRAANVTEHRVVLTGLKPATAYWYRVCFKPILTFAAYRVDYGPEQQTPPTRFETLPGPRQKVSVVVFNDLHNDTAVFQQLRQVVGDTPFDFTIFNGDCFADPASSSPAVAALSAFTQGVQAGSRPAFFLRGNHETRGAFARELPRFLGWPGNKPYFAFSAGPVRWVVLDCGEDKPDDTPVYAGLADFDSFRREEAEWLKSELRSSAFRKATWRVLVHHIPLHASRGQGGYCQPCQQLWAPLLAKARVDLALNGHTHVRAFHPAGTIGNPYPVVIGGGSKLKESTVMILEADPQRLRLRVLDSEGAEVWPAFEKKR